MKIRSFIAAIFVIAVLVGPSISHAATNSELLQQITQLLAQVQSLQSQLQTVEGGSTVGPVHTTAGASASCVSISYNLKKGDNNSEVTKLQSFLAQDRSVYPEATVSGYYGSLTEAAVQRWQVKNGVVSDGTAATTGYGAVGPRTRAALQGTCAGGTSSISTSTAIVSNGVLAKPLVVTPEVGALPLQVTVTFSLNSSSCTSYNLDWGDGSVPLSFDAGNPGACSQDIAHKRATHTYTQAGVHHLVLRAGPGSLYQAVVVGQTFVSVGQRAQTGVALNPTSGVVPFTTSVTFPVTSSNCTAYEVQWGDGSTSTYEPKSFTNCNSDSGTDSLTHTYQYLGTFDVTFKSGRAPLSALAVSGSWKVIVDDTVSTNAALHVSPISGFAPLIVAATIEGYGEECTSYSIDWGDGTAPASYEGGSAECYNSYFHNEYTHTYQTPGAYTVRTKIGRRTLLSDLYTSAQTIVVGSQ